MKRLPFCPETAGVDEAGRGPLAGPVVVAAVLIPKGFRTKGIADSKALSAEKREEQYARIMQSCITSVVVVDHGEIDRINILQATLFGMSESLRRLPTPPSKARVDGNIVPPDCPCAAEAWIKGDAHDAAIAAASILAKVTRDRLMVEADALYPGYGFASHKGYSCKQHFEAIRTLGPSPIHRRSFEPVRTMVSQPCLLGM